MIEWLLEQMSPLGEVAVLSRGYKRVTTGFLRVTPELNAEEAGDEPLQIARKFPENFVAVDANRQRGIAKIEEQIAPTHILLDDAYQHRKVRANMYILLTAFDDLYIDDWYLPTGNLRDHKKEARRAHTIIVTKCPLTMSQEAQEAIKKRLKPKPGQELLFCGFEYQKKVHGLKGTKNLKDLGENILVVTGIANPDPLLRFLNAEGITHTHQRFPDHHFFSGKEYKALSSFPVILTTEKDYTRMGGRLPNAFYIAVEHLFLGNGRELLNRAINAL
jgi:tetraacyldisaccharide 4'-kinase